MGRKLAESLRWRLRRGFPWIFVAIGCVKYRRNTREIGCLIRPDELPYSHMGKGQEWPEGCQIYRQE